jgi:WASH complex subunit strumpellin
MEELSLYFGGGPGLGKVVPDESYKAWFSEMKIQISNLTFNDSTFAGRKIQQLIKALEDIEQYHQIANSIQIKHYLDETRNELRHMIRIVNVHKDLLTHIALISVNFL